MSVFKEYFVDLLYCVGEITSLVTKFGFQCINNICISIQYFVSKVFSFIFRFRQENINRLDLNQRAQFAGQAASSWLNFHLQVVGVVMVGGIAFIAVLQHHLGEVSPGKLCICIGYVICLNCWYF